MTIALRRADLAWLLTSPSLLDARALPPGIGVVGAALGRHLAGQLQTAPLDAALATLGETNRLGRYAEALLRAGFASLPSHRLFAVGLPVRQDGKSLGEFDFLLEPRNSPQTLLHIELAVKAYLALPESGRTLLVGPSLHDAWVLKRQRLIRQQLRLSQRAAARVTLPEGVQVQPMAWVRGWIFTHTPGDSIDDPSIAADALRGWWRVWGESLPDAGDDSRWRVLPKLDWMAVRPADASTPTLGTLKARLAHHFEANGGPVLVACYAPPELGGAERSRGFILPPSWPDPLLLAALRAEIEVAERSIPPACGGHDQAK